MSWPAEVYPQWCLVCAGMTYDNACGHFRGPMPPAPAAVPKPGRILVRIQGKEYVGHCKACGWQSHRIRRTLTAAGLDFRRHWWRGDCQEDYRVVATSGVPRP